MEKVVVRRCETYDKDFIKSMIREGMEELGFKPTGKAMRISGCPVIVPWFMVRVMASILGLRSPFLDMSAAGTSLPTAISSYGRKALNLLRA